MSSTLHTCNMTGELNARAQTNPNGRSRRWTITSYKSKVHWLGLTHTIPSDKVVWLIAGSETCPDTGRSHMQAAIVLKSSMTMSALKSLLGEPGAHLERMVGTPQQSEVYCSKEDSDPLVMGKCPQQGKRTDLADLKEALDQGASDKTLWQEHFPVMLKYDQACKRYRAAVTVPRNGSVAPTIVIHTGPTRCGKTRLCPKGDDVYWHNKTKWWCGYDKQKIVVFDEFYGQIPFQNMLSILDRYECKVETKGGTVQLIATEFWFTSNSPYENWWLQAQADGKIIFAAFEARIAEFGTVTLH